MGIRFLCPNGHKLNVKSFLAGKRGICPHCGAKVNIPLESTRESTHPDKKTEQPQSGAPGAVPIKRPGTGPAALPSGGTAPMARPVGPSQGQVPMAQPAGSAAAANQGAMAAGLADTTVSPALQQAPAMQQPSTPVNPAPVAAAPTVPDPIAEAPQAVWYVRPSTGGQFGPASGQVMQQWLDEGRVAADSLVWREGWPDWKSARETFPKFTGQPGGASWPFPGSPF